MYKHIVNGFAAHEEEQIEPCVDAGRHTCANYTFPSSKGF